MSKSFQLTPLERSWVLYDVGNSAFVLLFSTLLPIYFSALAEGSNLSPVDYLAYWGYATSFVTLVVALIGPILGTISDLNGMKKRLWIISVLVGVLCCALMGLAAWWLPFLAIFVVSKIGYSISVIFYDAMLHDVTTTERMDQVSTHGYAWGYIGSCLPFVLSLVLVLGNSIFGLSLSMAMHLAFVLIALWWLAMSFPLFRRYRQVNFTPRQGKLFASSFSRLGHTLASVKKDKKIFLFLLAFFFYIDGVYTIIEMATAYGEALGLDSTGLLLALLVTQLVAFPSTIFFSRLSNKHSSDFLISVAIVAYIGIAIFAYFLQTQLHFWILAVCVGLFQGGIQGLSRAHFAKIIPSEKSGEYFGLMDICGKGASFLGTTLVSLVSQLTGNINQGVGVLTFLFLIGFVLFRKSITCDSTT